MNKTTDVLERQRSRYDREAQEHHSHYQDPWTQEYRDRFYRSIFTGIELKGKVVLDAMCASGIETGFLVAKGADVVGVDISAANAQLFRARWGLPCNVESIHKTSFESESFDIVYVMGGLHHVKPLLAEVIDEIWRILKPGGYFFFIEPNKNTWVNTLRNIWYKKNSRFAAEEEAISYESELLPLCRSRFSELRYQMGGNIAYLVVAQSMHLRIPTFVKRITAKPLFVLESWLTRSKLGPALFFSVVWQKQTLNESIGRNVFSSD